MILNYINLFYLYIMKVKHINRFKIDLPAKGAFTIPVDDDFPKLHTLCIVSGRRGGGKGIATANFIRTAREKHYFDKVFLITPTYESNKAIWDIAKVDPGDVYEPTTDAIAKVLDRVQQERDEWDDFLEKKKSYLKFIKDKKNLSRVTDDDLIIYYDMLFLDGKKPEWKYAKEEMPKIVLVVDDCVGTDIMAKRTAGLLKLAIAHRHVSQGMGISLILNVQSYCAQASTPRPIRENCTLLMLFKVNDDNQLKKIKEEADLEITDEEFEEMTTYIWSIPYNFLMIDFATCLRKKYRSGFNDYIIPKSIEGKCTCEKCHNKLKIN